MKMTKKEYKKYAEQKADKSKIWRNMFNAFWIGGLICTIGQFFLKMYMNVGFDKENASTLTSISLVFFSALLTGLNVYDNIAKWAGAGTLVPITGFANAVVSPAMEFKNEGYVMGVATNIFKIAGPVITYGIIASVLAGVIYLFVLGDFMNRVGNQTIILKNLPKIAETASVVGQKENDGKYSGYFDYVIDDGRFGEKSWEKAESRMQKKAVEILLRKSDKNKSEIDFIAGGDLLNQCMGTSFGLADFNIPFFGLYGACSTMAESLCIAAMTVDGEYSQNTIAVTSSHFCSSERQFRFPLEYGGQRTPTSQWTVTGSGAALVSQDGSDIAITHITPGRIVDMGIKDANNMGAAMAPSAIDTISAHFKDREINENYYDLVVTGDLGKLGHAIAKEQLAKEGLDFGDKYIDCGMEIFDLETQDVHAGGSGCGCCASVFAGYIYSKLKKGDINRVLIVATGALMSTTSSFQGESIPGIAHAVAIERV